MRQSDENRPIAMLVFLSVLALYAAVFSSGFALAQSGAGAPYPESIIRNHNKIFFGMFMTRCMPGAHSNAEIPVMGLQRAENKIEKFWLKGRPGRVWTIRPGIHVIMVVYSKHHCTVMSRLGDPKAMGEKVLEWFEFKGSGFRRDKFEWSGDNEFSAAFSAPVSQKLQRRVLFFGRSSAANDQISLLATAAVVAK